MQSKDILRFLLVESAFRLLACTFAVCCAVFMNTEVCEKHHFTIRTTSIDLGCVHITLCTGAQYIHVYIPELMLHFL